MNARQLRARSRRAPRREITATVSMSRKVNLGNYESADAFVSLSGVSADTSRRTIDAVLNGGARAAWEGIREALTVEVRNMRRTPPGG